MTNQAEDQDLPNWTALQAVADELERWVEALPAVEVGSPESWASFMARRAEAERRLAERIRRLPGGRVVTQTYSESVIVRLADVRASSPEGLVPACRAWIAKVRSKGPT